MAMAEDRVGGEVVGGVHEVGLGGGALAGAADAGLRVADDAVFEIDQAGLQQGREREDDGGRVAAGIGDEARLGDLRRVQLGRAEDGLCLELAASCGVASVSL